MNKTVQWLGTCGLALALASIVSACGAVPTAQGQSGATTDVRTSDDTGLDEALLKQVDAALAAAKAQGQDVSTAQTLRDSAVELAGKGFFAEANGNLKSAAGKIGVLTTPGGATQAVQDVPPAPNVAAVPRGSTSLLSVQFSSLTSLDGWERVGPSIPIGTPLWELENGLLVQRGVDGVDAADEQTGLVTGSPTWGNVSVTVHALARDTKELGLIVRQEGESYYRFRALVIGTGGSTGNYILEKVVEGQVSELATFDGNELSSNTWHTLQFDAQGSTLSVSVDGQALGSVEDATLSTGRVGVSTLAMSGAYFADLQVTGR